MAFDFTGIAWAVVTANAVGAAAAIGCALYTGLFDVSRAKQAVGIA